MQQVSFQAEKGAKGFSAASEDLHLGAFLPSSPATGQARCGWLYCCLEVICCRQVPR